MWHNRRRFLLNSKQLCSNFGTSKFVVSCLFAVFAVQIVSCQDACSSGPCYPNPTDIAGNFNVTANSTCGDPPETFCVNLNCSNVCNANSDGLKHPPSFVNDDIRANTFWKSKNYEYPVVLQLDTGRTFMLYESTVTFYHELPAAMYFLKSNDSGLTYRPITYFATNCTKYFNLPETADNERDGLQVQCFKIDTSENPRRQVNFVACLIFICNGKKVHIFILKIMNVLHTFSLVTKNLSLDFSTSLHKLASHLLNE